MDIQHLVDRLEELIDEGRHLFGTKYTMIDEERALEIIDQMRISIPEEIEKSVRILQQRERILSEAHEEAARIVQQHRYKAEQLVDEDARVQAARVRAENVLEQARQEAARITAEADQYVMDLLKKLEQQLTRNLTEVRNGISVMVQAPTPFQADPAATQPMSLPVNLEEEVEVGRKD
jgi:vacuolar-type H+-ATPase subunit H